MRGTLIDGTCATTGYKDAHHDNMENPGNTCKVDHPGETFLGLGDIQLNPPGTTPTMLPAPNAPPVDKIEPANCLDGFPLDGHDPMPLRVDQRGVERPQSPPGVSPERCDIGAVEVEP